MEQLILLIQAERVDDLPLLLAQLERMQVAALLDKHFPVHGPWAGALTVGEVAVVWVAASVSEGDHRLNHVETWASAHLQTLTACLGKRGRAVDCSDDRLGDLLEALRAVQAWREFEAALNQSLLRVYDLSSETVLVDSITTKTYGGVAVVKPCHETDGRACRPRLLKVGMEEGDCLCEKFADTPLFGKFLELLGAEA
jgi:hypothetical protein